MEKWGQVYFLIHPAQFPDTHHALARRCWTFPARNIDGPTIPSRSRRCRATHRPAWERRQACFADAADYLHYRQELGEAALKYGCDVHAYVLMTNHVHLLVTPHEAGAASQMMQAIGRRYVGSFNARYRRTGTLWEGRFKSALVDSGRYVLTCYRYIELNPVRAAMVEAPAEYRWSSHGRNAHGAREPRITPHPAYRALGHTTSDREFAYRALFVEALPDTELVDLRIHTQQQKAWGTERFRQQIETLTRRGAGIRPRGRPRLTSDRD